MYRDPAPLWGEGMSVKVGRVPYLGFEPFYFDMERRGIEMVNLVPSALVTAIKNGEVDGGPLSLLECFHMDDHFQYLSGFCMSTITQATSVNLYSTKPIEELTSARIGIIDEASTAIGLLKVLLTLKYNVSPESYVTLQEPYDAFLLIGDQGLRNRRGARGFPYKYDLGEEWHNWTGLPFVFARWVARKNMDATDAAALQDSIYTAFQDWADGLFRVSETRNYLLMRPQDILEYTQGLRYFIGVPEQRAMDLFQGYLDKIDFYKS